jgi:hypothetical protein
MSIAFAQLPSEINHKESRTNVLSLTDELTALVWVPALRARLINET